MVMELLHVVIGAKEQPADPNGIITAADINEALGTILNTIREIWFGFLAQVPLLIGGLVLLFLTWLSARIFNNASERILSKFHLRPSQKQLIQRLATIGIWLFGLTVVIMVIFPGVTPSSALAGLGIGSIAVGFAFKDIFENFFAGILILWGFPFEDGDFIECTGLTGAIEEVTIRNTIIRQVSGELVVVPNADLFKNPVTVLTNRPLRRTTVITGIAYGENVDHGREVIKKAVESCPTVSSEKPVEIFAQEFASSSINYEVTWWTKPTPLDIRVSRDQVVAAVKHALDNAGIEIPFPYRTLTFKQPLKLEGQTALNE